MIEIPEKYLISLITEHFINLIEEIFILKDNVDDKSKAILAHIFDNIKSNFKLFESEFGNLNKTYFYRHKLKKDLVIFAKRNDHNGNWTIVPLTNKDDFSLLEASNTQFNDIYEPIED